MYKTTTRSALPLAKEGTQEFVFKKKKIDFANQNFSILFWASSTRCIRSNIRPTDWGEPPRIFSSPIVAKMPA